METVWEPELARFLSELSAVQDETLAVLTKKRQLLVDADTNGLAAIAPQEQELITRLQQCLDQREQLLRRASEEGLPAENLKTLTRALPKPQRDALARPMQAATARTRLLQHQGLTNWLLVQRTLLHLAQMLEIIATGGRLQPTYGRGEAAAVSGALVDRAA
jgi:flagellar biosynthesis/type III secretory pathway chaperone